MRDPVQIVKRKSNLGYCASIQFITPESFSTDLDPGPPGIIRQLIGGWSLSVKCVKKVKLFLPVISVLSQLRRNKSNIFFLPNN